jgi:hypothetical protein
MSSEPPHALELSGGSEAPDKGSKATDAKPGLSLTVNKKAAALEPFACYNIENQYFNGPKGKGAYASICVLDPIITIERHHGKYHIAAAFNIETTILRYSTQKRSDSQ